MHVSVEETKIIKKKHKKIINNLLRVYSCTYFYVNYTKHILYHNIRKLNSFIIFLFKITIENVTLQNIKICATQCKPKFAPRLL